jgi:hypothetical protein
MAMFSSLDGGERVLKTPGRKAAKTSRRLAARKASARPAGAGQNDKRAAHFGSAHLHA